MGREGVIYGTGGRLWDRGGLPLSRNGLRGRQVLVVVKVTIYGTEGGRLWDGAALKGVIYGTGPEGDSLSRCARPQYPRPQPRRS